MTTLTTITNQILDPTGQPVAGRGVVIALAGGNSFSTDAPTEVYATFQTQTDATGTWAIALKPTADIGLGDTYYIVTEPGGTWAFSVPATGGPYWLHDVLVVSPTSPLAPLGVVRYDVAQTLTSGQKTQAQTNIAADPAGSAATAQTNAQTFATSAVAAEATTRATADTANATAITAEATARANADALLIPLTQKGAASGVAPLDGGSRVPEANLPPDLAAATLAATYAPIQNAGPTWSGKAAGVHYNGTDESTTFQSILNAASAFGVGTLILEGIVRCDSQITIPTTVVGGVSTSQAPLRITGVSAQHAPGSTFSGSDPFPGIGLDLRYAGRTDSGVTTTLGSAIVGNTSAVSGDAGQLVIGPGIADNTWILASNVGVGWTLSKAARATGTVSLTSMGGRIQSIGYGTLEIDHTTFLSGAATSAPFGLSTATRVNLHDNVYVGVSGKSGSTCDEDPWVFGGTGQGTNLTTALTSGNTYTTLGVKAIPVGLNVGRTLVIGAGANTQTVTIAAPAPATGDTTITVSSFVANANYPLRTGVAFNSSTNQSLPTTWSTPSSYHQGFKSRMVGNQFYRCRRIGIGGFTTDLSIDDNGWMHDCGSNVAVAPSTLTSALVAGTTYTALAVTALSAAVITGDVIQVGVGDAAMEFVASAGASAGATSVSVNSQAAAYAAAIGTKAFNSTAGIGAAIYSYADFVEANTVHIRGNRIGVSGGYTHMTRFTGATVNSVIEANDLQDMQADPNFIACHRFDRGSSNNTIITGLQGTGNIVIDDWSASTGITTQTLIDPVHGSRFPTGLIVGGSLTFSFHSGSSFTGYDLDGDVLFTISGALRQWNFKGPLLMDGNSGGAGSTYLTIGNNSTASDAQIILNPPTGQSASIQWKYAGTNRWLLYNGAGNGLFLRDSTNSLMFLTFTAGSGTTGLMDMQASLKVQGKVGFNGTTPLTKPTATPTDAVDLATSITLLNYIKNNVILAYGLAS